MARAEGGETDSSSSGVANILRDLEPVNLLGRMYYQWDMALCWHCGPIRRVYRRMSEDIIDAQCANCDREIETGCEIVFIPGQEELEGQRRWLATQGIPSKVIYREAERGLPACYFAAFLTNRSTLLTIRNLAKAQVKAVDPAEQEQFDRKFNLYFNQHYAFDWKEWRERAPLESWPYRV